MQFPPETIEKLAHLAKLTINKDDFQNYQSHLSNIVTLIDQMTLTPTDQVSPMAHPLADMQQRLRPDVVTQSDQHTLFQTLAPQVEAGLYLVPAVLETTEGH